MPSHLNLSLLVSAGRAADVPTRLLALSLVEGLIRLNLLPADRRMQDAITKLRLFTRVTPAARRGIYLIQVYTEGEARVTWGITRDWMEDYYELLRDAFLFSVVGFITLPTVPEADWAQTAAQWDEWLLKTVFARANNGKESRQVRINERTLRNALASMAAEIARVGSGAALDIIPLLDNRSPAARSDWDEQWRQIYDALEMPGRG